MQERTISSHPPRAWPARILHPEKHLDPQKAADGLCVCYAAIAHHFDRRVEAHGDRFDELAGVEPWFSFIFQLPCKIELNRLVGIGNGGMDGSEARPLGRGLPGL